MQISIGADSNCWRKRPPGGYVCGRRITWAVIAVPGSIAPATLWVLSHACCMQVGSVGESTPREAAHQWGAVHGLDFAGAL